MIKAALDLFMLRKHAWAQFEYPVWHSIVAITLLGLLFAFDPSFREIPDVGALPLWAAMIIAMATVWAGVLVSLWFLGFWLKIGNRWNGRGRLFNLITAALIVCSILSGVFTILELPALLILVLWGYSIWVCGNALAGAIPDVTLKYGVGGVVMLQLPAMVAMVGAAYLAGAMLGVLWAIGILPASPLA